MSTNKSLPCHFAISLLLLFSIGTISNAIEKPAAVEVSGKIKWVYDYAQGQKLGKELNRPLFVVFRCER